MSWYFLAIPRWLFLGKGRIQPFVHLYYVLVIYGAAVSEQKVIKFPSPPYFWRYFIKTNSFLFLIFVCTMSSSSWVYCPSLMFSWSLIIFLIGLSVTIGEFPSRFLKCSFHICIRSTWQAASSFALDVLFFLLTSFTVCYAITDCLSFEWVFNFTDLALNVFYLFFLVCVN